MDDNSLTYISEPKLCSCAKKSAPLQGFHQILTLFWRDNCQT